MVIWLIGVSGSGKTFYGKKLTLVISKKKKVIHIDGDEVRKYLNYKLKYSKKDREKKFPLISDLCNFLEKKGFLVICSILSIIKKHQKRNRKLLKNICKFILKLISKRSLRETTKIFILRKV